MRELGVFVWNNLLLLGLTFFFFYRTFLEGKLNWALLIFLMSLCGFIVCRVLTLGQGRANVVAYRLIMLTSVTLLMIALFIQTMRFIFVFQPGLSSDPTLAKLLVRIGITSLVLYVFALVFAGAYYLHSHNMIKRLWNPWLPKLLDAVFAPQNWKQVRRSTLLFMRVLAWGGLATALLLGIGFVAWLLRNQIYIEIF
jgi:hypothetical protein